jgi:protein-disulfide isomerase
MRKNKIMIDQINNQSKKNIFIAGVIIFLIVVIAIGASAYVFKKSKTEERSTAVNNLQKNNAQNLSEINVNEIKAARPLDDNDHLLGKIGAPVAITFYGDFDCPFSADFYETLKKAKAEYGDKIVIGFRHYPLRTHDLALPAALASECAAEQGKFWEMADKLFTDKMADKLSVDQFTIDAQAISLDADKFKQCFDEKKYQSKIQNDWQEGKDSNIIGTPGSFINGTQFSGALPWDDYVDQNSIKQDGLKSVIDKLLSTK